jgi:type I restriction enzyme S subunit
MGNKWRDAALGDLVTFQSGGTPSKSNPAYWNGTIPWISAKDMKQLFLDDSEDRITDSGAKNGTRLVPRNTVLMLIRGMTLLNDVPICIVRKPMTFNQDVKALRANEHLDDAYLPYLMLGNKPRLKNMVDLAGHGTGRLNTEELKRLEVRVPPLREQQAIACILGVLDDKIELNRRRNQTLEAMARAIFQSWFVDFDPVRAKAEGRLPAGLSKEVAGLFPSGFEDSELGEIPKGWRVTTLADEITANKGLSYKGDYLAEAGEGLPMHNLNSVYEGGGYKHQGLKWYTGEYRPQHILQPGDVIVTNTEQGFDYLLIGYSAIVPKRYGDKGLFSHHIYRIRAKETSYLPTWFTYLLLRTPVFHELVAGHSNGTTVNMLPLDGLQKPRFVRPTEPVVNRFERWFTPALDQLEKIHDENRTLAALRNSLLPRLISGELRVPDAERIVGRAL